MYIKRKCIFAIFAVLLFFSASLHGNPTGYTVRSTMPNLHINAFAQDDSGYIWIGTAKGLCRYNGYEYFCYTHDPLDERSIYSDFVTSLYVDSEGCLWVSTDKGLCTYDFYNDDFNRFSYRQDSIRTLLEYQCLESGGDIYVCGVHGLKKADRQTASLIPVGGTHSFLASSLLEDDFSGLWICGLLGQGIWYLENGMPEAVNVFSAPGVEFYCSYKTPSGDIWFGSNRGITAINPITKKTIACDLETRYPELANKLNIKFITELELNRIMIGTENNGALIYDFANGQLTPFDETDFIVEINSVHFTSCYIDDKGNKWLGTFDKGYFMEPNRNAKFNTDKRFNSLFSDMFVTRIVEDGEGNFWIGTRYNGIIYYDSEARSTTCFNSGNFEPLKLSGTNLIENLFLDSAGNLWIGTLRLLIKCRVGDGRIIDYSIVNDIAPSTITEDSHNNIWVGSALNGLFVIRNGDTGRIENVPLIKRWNNVTSIAEGRDGKMYFSVYDDGMYVVSPGDMQISALVINDRIFKRLERIITMYIDSKNILWAGTYGGGLLKYDIENARYASYTESDGLPDKNVVAISEDYQGNIWMSTSYGLCKLDKITDNISVFYDDDGIGGNQFHEKAVLKSINGRIYFGGNHGLTYFDSREVTYRNYEIPVVLEDLKVMNISEKIGRPDGILQSHISKQDAITLTHKHTTFNIDFAGIDFGSSKKIRYAYRLLNFDKDWNYVSDYRRATYSNLSPGKYTFEVMAQNYNGTWSDNPTRLAVTVLASPWLRGEAMFIYFLLAALFLWAGIHLYIKMKLNNEKLVLAERQNEYQQEMTSMKIRFFTNISHELRTPLTMIYGPVKKLMDGNADGKTKDYLLNLLSFNVNNLLRLTDQLMDFARLENDTLALSIAPSDPVALARNIVNSYNFFAQEKNITLVMEAPDSLELFIDSDKVSKILSNLISNALKYTPEGGHITVRLHNTLKAEGNALSIEVRDDGIGMKEEDLKHLFKRYKRFGSKDDYSKNPGGKGIGLNYVKRLVDIHKGIIEASLNPDRGMTFSVCLPADRDYFAGTRIDEVKYEYSGREEPLPVQTTAHSQVNDVAAANEDIRDADTILVVEDDTELNKFITSLLREDYNVLNAKDGMEGLEVCRQAEIVLIVSDVLMPRMNGYEFCRTVKDDPELCHLPFVMLTAKTLDENQIEGYDHGADYYLSKPFNPDVLKRVIRNTLNGIEKRKTYILRNIGKFGSETEETGENREDTPAMAPFDKRFLEKLYECIENDITNTNLNVNELSSRLAFSRTSFYRKVKALTGLSPNELLKVYRLEKAVQLLETEEHTISEVVDLTGFGTHSHFSTTFKKHFGINPKRYKGSKAKTK